MIHIFSAALTLNLTLSAYGLVRSGKTSIHHHNDNHFFIHWSNPLPCYNYTCVLLTFMLTLWLKENLTQTDSNTFREIVTLSSEFRSPFYVIHYRDVNTLIHSTTRLERWEEYCGKVYDSTQNNLCINFFFLYQNTYNKIVKFISHFSFP